MLGRLSQVLTFTDGQDQVTKIKLSNFKIK
jgi:hypothetical protein